MPAKWKIFIALNFIIALPAFICLVLLIINFSDTAPTANDYWIFYIFIFALAMMTVNGFLNIFLLQRYYPDKLIPVHIRLLASLSFILIIIITLVFLIVCIIGATEEFGPRNNSRDISGKIALVISFFSLLIQTIVLFMQGQLPSRIRRNQHNSMHSLIDSIGQAAEREN